MQKDFSIITFCIDIRFFLLTTSWTIYAYQDEVKPTNMFKYQWYDNDMLNNLDINEIWPKDNDMMQIGGEEIENQPMNMVLKGIVF